MSATSRPIGDGSRADAPDAAGRPTTRCCEIDGLVKHFPIKAGIFKRTVGAGAAPSTASTSTSRGARRSASSASRAAARRRSAARCIKLIEPTAGSIVFDGQDITALEPTAHARRPPRDPDRLPGPVRVAEPAHDRARDRRRAAPRSTASTRRRREGARRRAAAHGRAEPGARQPLPARVLGRPAAAHRHRPCARAQPDS